MNVEYANTIPLRAIFDKIGLQPAQENNSRLLYQSLFSVETIPTLQIHITDNTWCDISTNNGGNAVDFVKVWLAHQNLKCSVHDALHWLKFNIGYPPLSSFLTLADETEQGTKFKFRYKTLLLETGLIRYAQSRGISSVVAKQFFKQLYILNQETGKEFLALGYRNEDGGYAIYSPFVDTHIAPVTVTFIRGRPNRPNGIHLFKDIFDYLTALAGRDHMPFSEDAIVLNAYRCLDDAASYIRGYGYSKLYSWFDKSETGQQVTEACGFLAATEPELSHVPMSAAHNQEGK